MSPTCTINSKHSMHRKTNDTKKRKKNQTEDFIFIDLDTKCHCSHLHPSIQFSRRYLQCQSSMPIAILRSFVQQIIPHSSITQISFYDMNNRLLNDSDTVGSMRCSTMSHIPIRFTLINPITSSGQCPCLNSSTLTSASSPLTTSSTSIRPETISQTLSTCSFPLRTSFASTPIEYSIVNLLTPPPCSPTSSIDDRSFIDEITKEFGEICPPPRRKVRRCETKKRKRSPSNSSPLDLSMKIR